MHLRRCWVILFGLVVLGAACGGDDGSGTTAITTATTETPVLAPDATEPESAGPVGGVDGATFRLAAGWTGTVIGEGVKPVLSLSPGDTAGIAYLLEDLEGFIAYADAAGGWAPQTVAEGYFYGPIGLTYAPDGTPYVAYHDHQADSFVQELGDLTVAHATGSGWEVEAIEDDGHDGWDSTIVAGPDGVLRAAGIDPQQFDRDDGVEYFERTGAGWEVTAIGSGPIAYEFNVGLAVQPNGEPALTYYDNNSQALMFASRSSGSWSIEVVDDEGDTGRYSSLVFDADGVAHISYVQLSGTTTGTVKYARGGPGQWTVETVTELTNILTGFTGARRITDIAIDGENQPRIAFGDEQLVGWGWRDATGWVTETVVEAGDLRLGQLVSFELAGDGTPHIALFEVTRTSPLTGVVVYLTTE